MTNHKQFWDTALAEIEVSVSKANFGTWFKNSFIQKFDDGIVYLGVPNPFVKDWLSTKYHKFILKALRNCSDSVRGLEYIIVKPEDRKKNEEKIIPEKDPSTDSYQQAGDLGLGNLYIDKNNNLNPKYTFDNFIVGSFNEIAHAACQAVVKNPGMSYNPLFIYGGTGLGKTHLIQAVGNQIRKLNDSKKVFYVTSEQFTLDCVNSILNNKGNLFKEKYRKYDLLIMDDIQFFSNKEKTQEELFHLFNSYYENNKQIVFSSDKPPKYIDNLEERLRSRFEGGMVVDVSKPDYESRLVILKAKAEKMGFNISDEVLEYIASVVQDNVRELEGVLNSLICQAQTRKKELSLTEVKGLIKNNLKPQKTLSIKDIMTLVAEFYSIEEHYLYEKTRRKEVVKPRQIIMYLLREDFNTSYPYIGQKLGGRDHTTVIHAYEKIKKEIKVDLLLNQEIEQIRGLLYNEK